MKKIYEAYGDDKEGFLDCDNDYRAFHKARIKDMGVYDLLMLTKVDLIPQDGKLEARWCINGILEDDKKDIIICEPFVNQMDNGIKNISSNNTQFNEKIELSKKSIVLMTTTRYEELCKNKETKKQLRKMNVRLYEGKEILAVKMLMQDKGYLYFDIDENGYIEDKEEHPDRINLIHLLNEGLETMDKQVKSAKQIEKVDNRIRIKRPDVQTKIQITDGNVSKDCQMITGLTKEVEGEISLDKDLYASTDIGKIRENQEDAVLLMHDKENPNFKMMVVADGMGGWSSGKVASNEIIKNLKDWFENLTDSQKNYYNTSLQGLEKDLKKKIEFDLQIAVENATWQCGGTTLVCALIGENDTLVANIGDSRAYIAKKGKLIQLSREDTEAQLHLEKGKLPTKEAARFDVESNMLTQALGMERRMLIEPYTKIIKNSDYDLLMLFTDGVTDCLSDDDIVAVCRTTNKRELARKIVEKAIRHDSFAPEEYSDYCNLNAYISGGKDNATAAVYAPEKDEEER